MHSPLQQPFFAARYSLSGFFIGLFIMLTACTPAGVPAYTPTPDAVTLGDANPVQQIARLEVEAARTGWTLTMLREAGAAWQRAGSEQRAAPYWEALLNAVPVDEADPALRRTLAAFYLRTGDQAAAFPHLTALIDGTTTAFSDRAWAHMQRGLLMIMIDPLASLVDLRAAGAEPAYANAVRGVIGLLELGIVDPMRLAAALDAASLFDGAVLLLEQVLMGIERDDPEVGVMLAYAALLRLRSGEPGDRYLRAALTGFPADSRVHFLAGLYWRETANWTDSIAAFQTAAALDPNDSAVYGELGLAYEAFGDLESARVWLERAVAFDSANSLYLDDLERVGRTVESVIASLGLTPTPSSQPIFERTPDDPTEATDEPDFSTP